MLFTQFFYGSGTAPVSNSNKLYAWGLNTGGQAPWVPVTFSLAQISAGTSHTAAITSDYRLLAWGLGTSGQLGDNTAVTKSIPVQIGTSSWQQVSAGLNHTVAIDVNGKLWSWGLNNAGQLGLTVNFAGGDTINRSSPVQIGTGSWSQVSAGASFTAGITSTNLLYTWGINSAGQLGTTNFVGGDTFNRSSPVQVGTSSWTQISTGASHTTAIKADNTLWSWGQNNAGQLGNGLTTNRSSPVQIGTSSWSQVEAGTSFTVGIISTNLLYAWGLNSSGQLGLTTSFAGGDTFNRSSPVQVGTSSWTQVSAGGAHTSAIKTDNTLWTWGLNSSGQLGDNTTLNKSSPIQVGSASNWSLISAGSSITVAVNSTSSPFAWGNNAPGAVGDGFAVSRSSPVSVQNPYTVYSYPVQIGTSSWTQVSMGGSHGVAIAGNNLLFAWGVNANGQIGDFTSVTKSSPVQIGTSSWTAVTAGSGDYTVAIRSDNTLWAWGNTVTTLGQTTAENSWRTIGQTGSFGLGIKGDGTLWAWGANNTCQLGDGTTIGKSSPVQISSATNWTSLNLSTTGGAFAINSSGALYGWGTNPDGRLGDSSTLYRSLPVQVFSDKSWSIAGGSISGITSDGKLWSWGVNTQGQVGDGTTINKSSPVQISVGNSFVFVSGATTRYAITTTGNMYAWGLNNAGQIGDNSIIDKSTPVQLAVPANAFSWVISGGSNGSHAVAIKSDGSLWTWGLNSSGQLGLGTTLNRLIPIAVGFSAPTDTSANNFVITRNSGPVMTYISPFSSSNSYNTAIYGGSCYFNGTSDYLTAPANAVFGFGTGDWTIECWFYSTNVAKSLATLIDLRASGGGASQNKPTIHTTASTVIYVTQNTTRITSTTLSNNTWYHLAVTKASGVTKMFLDGIKVGSNYTDAIDYGTSSDVVIGEVGDDRAFDGYFPGYISNVRIVKAVAVYTTSSTVAGTQVFTIPTSPLTATQALNVNGIPSAAITGSATALLTLQSAVTLTSWSQVSAGASHTAATTILGLPFAWGNNASGQVGDNTTLNKSSPVSVGSVPFRQLIAPSNNVGGIRESGLLFFWGLNTNGQIGDNSTLNRSSPVLIGVAAPTSISSPVQIGSTSNNSSITAGSSTAGVIDSTGALYTWGTNNLGQLGDSTVFNHLGPFKIGTSSWAQVSMGPSHTLAIRSDGALFAWGSNVSNRLGDSTGVSKSSPIQIGSSSWTQVSAGTDHSMAIKVGGTLWGWGGSSVGQTGVITQPQSWSQIAEGSSFTIAIKTDNTLWSWGLGTSGQLGNGFALSRSSPIQIGTGNSWNSIFAGATHAGAIRNDGALFVWGLNSSNQLGDGTSVNKSSPVQIGSNSWVQVAGGVNHTLGILSDGTLYGWGLNTGLYSSTAIYPWAMVSEGASHTSAIRNDGLLFTWGTNASGQLGDNSTINRSSPVQIGTSSWSFVSSGGDHTLAIRSDGKLFAWGLNTSYEVGDGTSLNRSSPVAIGTSSWTQVKAGTNHSLALTSTNKLFAWGLGTSGQLGNLTGTSSWTQISAGNSTSAGITSDGQLYTWGLGTLGQLGDSSLITKSSPVLISSGTSWNLVSTRNTHSLAIQSDNSLWSFGQNNTGQLGDGTTTNRTVPVQVGGGPIPLDVSSFSHTTTKNGSSYTESQVPFAGAVSGSFSNVGTELVSSTSTDYVLDGDFTIDLWVYAFVVSNAVGQNNILIRGFDGVNEWDITYLRPGFTQALVFASNVQGSGPSINVRDNTVDSGTTLDAIQNKWTHMAVTRVGGTYNFYVDGVLGGSFPYNTPSVALTTGSTTISIGIYTLGYISQVRIVKGLAVYTGNFTPPSLGVLATSGASSASAYPSTTNVNTTFAASNTVLLMYTTKADSINQGLLSYNKISAGISFSAGINSTGSLYTWGVNALGQLGDNTTLNKSNPVQIGTSSWSQVSVGGVNTAAIDTLGRLYTWGSGQVGQLGDGLTITRSNLAQIGSSSWSQVSNGLSHALAITSDGKLFTWGLNNSGQLGNGLTTNRSAPVAIGTSSWLQVAAGQNHSMAIRSDNTLWAWGSAASGQLGTSPPLNTSSPVQVGTSSWSQVSAGTSYTLAIDINGILYAWGDDVNGKLGI